MAEGDPQSIEAWNTTIRLAASIGRLKIGSNLKASAGKYVLGPPVETEPPITVFTGLASKPDLVEQTVASGKTKHPRKKKIAAHPKKKKAAEAAPPAKKKPAKHAKAKVSSAAK